MEKIPFNENELQLVPEEKYGLNIRYPRINTPITPRENYLRYFRGEDPLWTPLFGDSIMMTPSIVADNVARGFAFECKPFDPVKEGGGKDMFGVEWEYVPTVGGSMVRPGKPFLEDIADWKDVIKFPDIESWDWAASAELNKPFIENDFRFKGITILNGMFERLISFCEMNNAMIFMIDEDCQDDVKELFDALADFYISLIKKFKEVYKIDYITFHDDWGSQRAPFFSLDLVKEMLVPPIKKIADATHDMGLIFELHSCGKNEMLVPAMIEIGVDMWDGQPMNDKVMLLKKYAGEHISFGAGAPGIAAGLSEEELTKVVADFLEDCKGTNLIGVCDSSNPKSRDIAYKLTRIAKCGE